MRRQAGSLTEELPLATADVADLPDERRRHRRAPWVIAAVVVLVAAGCGQ